MDDVNNLVDKLKGDVAYRQFDNAPAPNRQAWPVLERIADAQMRANGSFPPVEQVPPAPQFGLPREIADTQPPPGYPAPPFLAQQAAYAPNPVPPSAPPHAQMPPQAQMMPQAVAPAPAVAPPPAMPFGGAPLAQPPAAPPVQPGPVGGYAPVHQPPPPVPSPGSMPLNRMFGGQPAQPPVAASGSLLSRYGGQQPAQAPSNAPYAPPPADPSAVPLSDVFARLGRPSR